MQLFLWDRAEQHGNSDRTQVALLLGIALERATRMPVATYLQERLWKPAGMVAAASWSLDSEKDALEKLESGINARAEDFAPSDC